MGDAKHGTTVNSGFAMAKDRHHAADPRVREERTRRAGTSR
jgi:hypothetical protein